MTRSQVASLVMLAWSIFVVGFTVVWFNKPLEGSDKFQGIVLGYSLTLSLGSLYKHTKDALKGE